MKTVKSPFELKDREDVLRFMETKKDITILQYSRSTLTKLYELMFNKKCPNVTKAVILQYMRSEYVKESASGKYNERWGRYGFY